MRIGDGLAGMFVALLGLAVLLNLRTFPEQAGYFGPSLFPGFVAAGLLLCGILLLMRAIRMHAAAGFSIRLDETFRGRSAATAAFLMIVSILSFAFLGDVLGFQSITFLTVLVLTLWLRKPLILSITMATTMTIVLHLLFAKLLRVPLPAGLLEGLI